MDSRSRATSSDSAPTAVGACTGKLDALEDQRELRRLHGLRGEATVARERRTVAPALEAFRPAGISVAVPVDDADPVAATREEDEEVAAQGSCRRTSRTSTIRLSAPLRPSTAWVATNTRTLGGRLSTGGYSSASTRRCIVATSIDSGRRSTRPDRSTTSMSCGALPAFSSMNVGARTSSVSAGRRRHQ